MKSTRAVEPWVLEPLERFVVEAGARLTLVMTPSGQVIAQHGFARAVDVMAAAALGAGIVASTGELARMLEQSPFSALNQKGESHGIFLSGFDSVRGQMLVLVVYGMESSVGLVQLFFEELVEELRAAAPPPPEHRAVLAADFEQDLNQSLATLFR